MSAPGKLRFAVVGAGVIGDVHAAAIRRLSDHAELRLVVSSREEPAAAMAERHGAAGFSTDLEALWADPDIDAVAICTPTGSHPDLAVAALQVGKHVIIEKPIAVTLEAADRVVAAQQASGATAAVISQHRFDPSTEKVSAAITAGSLGRITSATASCAWWRGQSYYDSAAWRGTWAYDGGGATMNQAIHTIDLTLALLGTPTEVYAYTGCLAHERIEVEDTAVAVLRFQSGALGVIHATTAAYPGLDASLRVFGSKGSAVICDDALVYFHENVGPAPEIAFPDPGRAAGSCRRCCAPWPAMVAVHRAQKRRRDGVVAAQGQPLGRAPASRRRAHAGRTSCAAPLLGVNSFVLTAAAHGSTCGRRH